MEELTRKECYQLARSIENRGMLKAMGWSRLDNNLPGNAGGDSEAPHQSKVISFVINNKDYCSTEVYTGVLFVRWDGSIELVGGNWSGEDVRIQLTDNPIIDDIFYKELGLPDLNYLKK